MMPENQFYQNFGYDTLKIHAICADAGISREDMLAITYLHSAYPKTTSTDFDNDTEYALKSLEWMLGITDNEEIFSRLEEVDFNLAQSFRGVLISGQIEDLDKAAREFGTIFSQELLNRYKLLLDKEYRESIIQLYEKKVRPEMASYDDDRIKSSLGINEKDYFQLLEQLSGRKTRTEILKEELAKAVADEKYEEAARIRDEINGLV